MKITSLVLLAVANGFLQYNWNSCGSDTDLMKIGSVFVNGRISRGKTISMEINGHLAELVSSGKLHLVVKYKNIVLINEERDLCDEIDNCPIPAGDLTITRKIQIPKSAPIGRYSVHLSAFNEFDEQLLCVDLNLHISK